MKIGHLVKFLVVLCLCMNSFSYADSHRGQIRCPIISIRGSGKYYTRAANQFRCYPTERQAILAGLVSTRDTVTTISGTPTPTPTPTATPSPTPAGEQQPTPTPTALIQKNFSMSGTGGGASGVFIISALPAVVTYSFQGSTTDSFIINLRDSKTGFIRSQVTYGRGVGSNSSVIAVTGSYFLEVKAGQSMSWSLTTKYY